MNQVKRHSQREEILRLKTEFLLDQCRDFEFPRLISALRRLTGISRKIFCQDTHFCHMTLFKYESGKIIRTPEKKLVTKIANYYGVNPELLIQKAEKFVQKKSRGKYESA